MCVCENWTREAPLSVLLDDPLCQAVMARDRLDPETVAEAMSAAATRLRQMTADQVHDLARDLAEGARPVRNRMSKPVTTRPSLSPALCA